MRPTHATTRPSSGPIRRWRLFPRSNRFPKRWFDWFPLVLTMVVVVIAATIIFKGPSIISHLRCREGLLPSPRTWSQEGECVGVTGGPYAFGRPEFQSVMQRIAAQNSNSPCSGTAVTLGVLTTMTSPDVGSRGLHELEGIAAAQTDRNKAGCGRPIRLKVAQIGTNEQAAEASARLLAGDDGVMGVVGMGLSKDQSAKAIGALAEQGVPMVADVMTAEGFDRNGSKEDTPDFGNCTYRYESGLAQDYYYRIAFRNAKQIDQLGQYLKGVTGTSDVIVTSNDPKDPYTCTALPLIHKMIGKDVHEIRFAPKDNPAVEQFVAQEICVGTDPVRIVYAARARDLGKLLSAIGDRYGRKACPPARIMVASLSDGARMRAREFDRELEGLRSASLQKKAFVEGKVKLIYTPLADPNILKADPRSADLFKKFEDTFRGDGFDVGDLDDGWAINGYDALTTVATAVELSPSDPVTRSEVNRTINAFSRGSQSVVEAVGGQITFDNSGNRDDSKPVVVRLCPLMGSSSQPQTIPASAGDCPLGSPSGG